MSQVKKKQNNFFSTSHVPESLHNLRNKLKEETPHLSDVLTDLHGRRHNYLRISLTERCNLRCTYCMPEEGVELTPNSDLLNSQEIVKIAELFVQAGVDKIRLTGGEPMVRKDIVEICSELGNLHGIKKLTMTTNGITLQRKLLKLREAGLTGVNISLDTLDPNKFVLITRRLGWEKVMGSIESACQLTEKEMNDPDRVGEPFSVKINCVVTRGINDEEIVDFVKLTQRLPLEVRFIEYMPFDGNRWSDKKFVPFSEMIEKINTEIKPYQLVRSPEMDGPNPTSRLFHIENQSTNSTLSQKEWKGRVGFITSMSNDFCSTCNRLRLTADGNLKVCLFGNTEVSLRDIIRKHQPLNQPIQLVSNQSSSSQSKTCPSKNSGSNLSNTKVIEEKEIERELNKSERLELSSEAEEELYSVIQQAVQRKKAKHAGMYNIANQKNRPMILIGG